ncbi:hypothetical protein W909_17665 [Dickeya zeae EC1]|nr:hypothetical protein W909_17665 [Dickeya zeae EC1]
MDDRVQIVCHIIVPEQPYDSTLPIFLMKLWPEYWQHYINIT